MRGKVTKRSVDSLRPSADGAPGYLWDSTLPGFGARATAGGVVFVLQYRRGGRGSPTRRVTIGRHGKVTVEEARTLAKRMLGDVARGGDPAEDKTARRKAGAVADAVDRWLNENVATRLKPLTQRDCRRFGALIKRDLGSLPIGELSRARVVQWHQSMAATPVEGNRAHAWLSRIMSLTVAWGLRADNPCSRVEKFRETSRDRVLADDELQRLGAGLAHVDPTAASAIRLAALTGMRIGEVLSLDWANVALDRREARLPDAKAGARTVAFGAAAKTLLDGLPMPHEGRAFPTTYRRVHIAWAGACKAAGIKAARIHDLRHGALTAGARLGASTLLLRDLAGHRTVAMTQKYVSRQVEPVRDLADAVAKRIDAAMAGRTAEIITLARAARGD